MAKSKRINSLSESITPKFGTTVTSEQIHSKSDPHRREQIKTFTHSALAMSESESQDDLDKASLGAIESLLTLAGTPINRNLLELFLELALECSSYSKQHGAICNEIDSAVENGTLIRHPDGMLGLPEQNVSVAESAL